MKSELLRLNYLGGDIVAELVENNKDKLCDRCQFMEFDIIKDELPHVDAWLCRDVLFHFPNAAIQTVLDRFIKSDIRFFLTSHFNGTRAHPDIKFGRYRKVNLCYPPFNWPQPSQLIYDGDRQDGDRYLGIWENPKFLAR